MVAEVFILTRSAPSSSGRPSYVRSPTASPYSSVSQRPVRRWQHEEMVEDRCYAEEAHIQDEVLGGRSGSCTQRSPWDYRAQERQCVADRATIWNV